MCVCVCISLGKGLKPSRRLQTRTIFKRCPGAGPPSKICCASVRGATVVSATISNHEFQSAWIDALVHARRSVRVAAAAKRISRAVGFFTYPPAAAHIPEAAQHTAHGTTASRRDFGEYRTLGLPTQVGAFPNMLSTC